MSTKIYDFDDTLVKQTVQINGNNIRLPLESYKLFCAQLGLEENTRDRCLWRL
jgi:hypothetical protein